MAETIIGPRRQPFLFPGMPPASDEAHVMTVAVRRGQSWAWMVRDGGDRWRVLDPSGDLLGTVIGYDEALAKTTEVATEFGAAEALVAEATAKREAVREALKPDRATPEETADPTPEPGRTPTL